jgi:hypothetical protein
MIHAMKDLQRRFTINTTQVSSSIRSPAYRDPHGLGRSGHLSFTDSFTQAELAPDIFMRNGLSAGK